jgi:hypothetical protein
LNDQNAVPRNVIAASFDKRALSFQAAAKEAGRASGKCPGIVIDRA